MRRPWTHRTLHVGSEVDQLGAPSGTRPLFEAWCGACSFTSSEVTAIEAGLIGGHRLGQRCEGGRQYPPRHSGLKDVTRRRGCPWRDLPDNNSPPSAWGNRPRWREVVDLMDASLCCAYQVDTVVWQDRVAVVLQDLATYFVRICLQRGPGRA